MGGMLAQGTIGWSESVELARARVPARPRVPGDSKHEGVRPEYILLERYIHLARARPQGTLLERLLFEVRLVGRGEGEGRTCCCLFACQTGQAKDLVHVARSWRYEQRVSRDLPIQNLDRWGVITRG
jgi:hypothetical protein